MEEEERQWFKEAIEEKNQEIDRLRKENEQWHKTNFFKDIFYLMGVVATLFCFVGLVNYLISII